jgi:hypothetical protein
MLVLKGIMAPGLIEQGKSFHFGTKAEHETSVDELGAGIDRMLADRPSVATGKPKGLACHLSMSFRYGLGRGICRSGGRCKALVPFLGMAALQQTAALAAAVMDCIGHEPGKSKHG